jgi:hypothetical protein
MKPVDYQIEWHGDTKRGENAVNWLRCSDKITAECTASRLAQYADVAFVEILEVGTLGQCVSIYKNDKS